MTEPNDQPAGLRADQLQRLREAGRQRSYPQGREIFAEGDEPGFAVIIDAGTVMVTTSDADSGYTYVLGLRGVDELIGEFGCIDEARRCASAIAWTPVTASLITSQRFQEILQNEKDILYTILKTTIARLHDADELRLEFGAHKGFFRIVRALLDLATRYGELTVKNHELAGLAGVSRETVVRTLRELTKSGVIARNQGRIVILDHDRLRALVAGKKSD